MKKALVAMILVLVAAFCYAETGTYTVTLVSKVEKVDAQYVIRNAETGVAGAAVVYTTGAIANQDVQTSFEIVQSNNSNSCATILFQISATELTAEVDGQLYTTEGVTIGMNGVNYGSTVSFARVTAGAVAAGTVIGQFNVEWKTNANLIDATYNACVTLSATAL